MKYILLGTLGPEWAARHGPRVESAKQKLQQLGIKLEAVYYTQGRHDFVDVVDAPEPDALLTFSLWYVSQGYGRVEAMPAFDMDTRSRAPPKRPEHGPGTVANTGAGGFIHEASAPMA
jgi:uncharacterized protein with GYD domain